MDDAAAVTEDKPLWRRIVDFPLVAMLIGIAIIIFGISVSGLLAKVVPPVRGLTPHIVFDLICAVVLVALYKLAIRHLGEIKRDDLRLNGALKPLLLGLGAGLGVFSLAVAIAAAMGVYTVTGEGDFSDFLPALVLAAIFPAISEEMLFRGVLFRWLEEFGGSWLALIVTSALFGAAHLANPNASWVAAVGIALEAGVMLGAAYMLTRSLWLPMGIHAAWNFTQGEIYDIPVSGTPVHGLLVARLNGPPLLTGNGFGLEASLIAIVVATVFGLWLLWLAIRKGELMPPWWVRRGRLLARPA
ncbi:MAG TPA: type II CAAX endopeptidase family protein [Sphingomicrobium sp.]